MNTFSTNKTGHPKVVAYKKEKNKPKAKVKSVFLCKNEIRVQSFYVKFKIDADCPLVH